MDNYKLLETKLNIQDENKNVNKEAVFNKETSFIKDTNFKEKREYLPLSIMILLGILLIGNLISIPINYIIYQNFNYVDMIVNFIFLIIIDMLIIEIIEKKIHDKLKIYITLTILIKITYFILLLLFNYNSFFIIINNNLLIKLIYVDVCYSVFVNFILFTFLIINLKKC